MAIYEHNCFIQPQERTVIWRYLDLSKFESLLATRSLFFCRADKFSDPFEGSLPKVEADNRIEAGKRIAEIQGLRFNKSRALRNIAGLKKLHKRLKKGIVINCWHINNSESDAMWHLYLKDNEGVAIQTTVETLKIVIDQIQEKIGISKVRYLNYEIERWFHPIDYPEMGYNLYIPLVHKRVEFKHENELRLIHDVDEAIDDETYWNRQPCHIGKLIEVDIHKLIGKVYFPPTIDSKAISRIKYMAKKYGFNFKFEKSKLANKPLY